MPTTCDIEFENNPEKVIYAGQPLRGTVRLHLTEEKNVRGIYIRIRGKGHTYWTRGGGKNHRTYTADEIYLDERTYFMGGTSGEVRVSPGTYNHQFLCMVPAGLPTSFEGKHGYIRYIARVVLDIPMWPDKRFENPFTVIKAINLNADPALRNPIIVEVSQRFSLFGLLFCFSSDPIKIIAKIPVGGYTPGQIINIEINVKNDSDQPVSEFSVSLIKHITYSESRGSTKNEAISTTEQNTRACDVNQEEVIRVNIEVPPIPPTDVTTSTIIKVSYSIRIVGSVPCCHSNPVLYVPIIIGSYPIQDPYPETAVDSFPANDVNNSQQPSAPLLENGYGPPYPSAPFPNQDPPTYEEATHTDTDGKSFQPKYAMFKRKTSYST